MSLNNPQKKGVEKVILNSQLAEKEELRRLQRIREFEAKTAAVLESKFGIPDEPDQNDDFFDENLPEKTDYMEDEMIKDFRTNSKNKNLQLGSKNQFEFNLKNSGKKNLFEEEFESADDWGDWDDDFGDDDEQTGLLNGKNKQKINQKQILSNQEEKEIGRAHV
eukprot:TRINITY_DN627_c1_g1_i1.p1 TRINITY_DN627_c1_g1~~TRINITY_DN627_c1_g1_i1.p1  ORF type:complete len:164 (-),score=56.89 TRINITY_DN627_c1_g1_i1:55-546(-)